MVQADRPELATAAEKMRFAWWMTKARI